MHSAWLSKIISHLNLPKYTHVQCHVVYFFSPLSLHLPVLPNGPTAAAGGGGGPVPGGGGLMTVTQQVQDASGSSGATAAAVLVQQGEGGATSLALM